MRKWMFVALCAVALVGCQSAEEKCAVARDAALTEWSGYVQALEAARSGALAAHKAARLQLTDEELAEWL